jgi:hypothetical protein
MALGTSTPGDRRAERDSIGSGDCPKIKFDAIIEMAFAFSYFCRWFNARSCKFEMHYQESVGGNRLPLPFVPE